MKLPNITNFSEDCDLYNNNLGKLSISSSRLSFIETAMKEIQIDNTQTHKLWAVHEQVNSLILYKAQIGNLHIGKVNENVNISSSDIEINALTVLGPTVIESTIFRRVSQFYYN